MVVARAAQKLKDGDDYRVAVHVPNLAYNLEKRAHALNLQIVYEFGTVDSTPPKLPLVYRRSYARYGRKERRVDGTWVLLLPAS